MRARITFHNEPLEINIRGQHISFAGYDINNEVIARSLSLERNPLIEFYYALNDFASHEGSHLNEKELLAEIQAFLIRDNKKTKPWRIAEPNMLDLLYLSYSTRHGDLLRVTLVPWLPLRTYARICNQKNLEILIWMAAQKNTPPSILHKLMKKNNDVINIALAMNPNTSVEDLETLSSHPLLAVKQAVRDNPSAAMRIREILIRDLSLGE